MNRLISTPEANLLMLEGTKALAEVEAEGMAIDVPYLDTVIAQVAKEIVDLELSLQADPFWAGWKREFGAKSHMGNRQQLGMILAKMGHASTRLTDKGLMAVDEEYLLRIDNPFVKKFLAVEKKRKVKNTYLEGIKKEVFNGRLRSFFHLHTTKTWRSSSSQINFQNIPIRDPKQGKLIRKAFIPIGDDWLIVENDFKTLEVNISCCYHHDPNLIDYVKNSPPKDMHRDMASQLYLLNTNDKEYWKTKAGKDSRYCGKNGFVFPSFYGSFWAQIAPHLWEMILERNLTVDGVSLYDHLKKKGIRELGSCDPQMPDEGTFAAHVREVERDFWGNRFKVYKQWKDDWWAAYQRDLGFRYLTGFYVYGAGYRKNDVTNYPIQGAAFHCLLWVLIRLVKWLKQNRMKSRVGGQIHDSIIGNVWRPELQDYLNKVKELVTVDLPKAFPWICVPMTIEAEVAEESWDGKREWTLKEGVWAA